MNKEINYEETTQDELDLRKLCDECWNLGKEDSHRLYNPKTFNRILSRLSKNSVEEFKKRLVEEIDNKITCIYMGKDRTIMGRKQDFIDLINNLK